MKYIIVVPDGMADHAVNSLSGQTPLEAAHTPHMDFLANHGTVGTVQTIPEGMAPGSDIGNMALLGYDPRTCHTGRAPLEAANLNITLQDKEVVFRCNFTTIVDGKMIDYSAGHITTKEASILIEHLNNTIDLEGIQFFPGKSYRHLLTLKVRDVQAYQQMTTVPPHDILGQNIKNYLPKGTEAAMPLKLMELAHKALTDHPVNKVRIDLGEQPANNIWLWGQGTRPVLQPFSERFGLNGAIISAVDLVNGIGRLAGLDIIDVPGATGYYDTNFAGKAQYALNALKHHDFVYVHIEAPDEAGHNGNVKAKIKAIEDIDAQVLGPIINHFKGRDDWRILVAPDHPTPVALRTHTAEPVGFVMMGAGIKNNSIQNFNENTAKTTNIIFTSGESLIANFLQHNRQNNTEAS